MASTVIAAQPVIDRADTQALVAHGFGKLHHARYLLGRFEDASRARSWLASLASKVTTANLKGTTSGINVALTFAGLRRLGLPETSLCGFSREFREGMVSANRTRILGDLSGTPNDPANWDWGADASQFDVLLLLFCSTSEQLNQLTEDQLTQFAERGIHLIRELNTTFLQGNREHFGFRDGISQPRIQGMSQNNKSESYRDEIAAGEILLGFDDQNGETATGPVVRSDLDRDQVLRLCKDPAYSDFGHHGTYLVFRQLQQDVRLFWSYFGEQARKKDEIVEEFQVSLASKAVGRRPDGTPLVTNDESAASPTDLNAFGYHQDRRGRQCPIGAHIRRSNPRDALFDAPQASIEAVSRHRIVRRGRPYGWPVDESIYPDCIDAVIAQGSQDGGEEDSRGLNFICLNADISRQFEFIQQTWINNPRLLGQHESDDLIAGSRPQGSCGQFSIPDNPVRHRLVSLPYFVTVRGGGYFFLPSIKAIRFLGQLDSAS